MHVMFVPKKETFRGIPQGIMFGESKTG